MFPASILISSRSYKVLALIVMVVHGTFLLLAELTSAKPLYQNGVASSYNWLGTGTPWPSPVITSTSTIVPKTPIATATATPTLACLPSWKVVTSPNPPIGTNSLQGVAASSVTDVWAVGGNRPGGDFFNRKTLIEHWDGNAWSIVPGVDVAGGNNYLFGVAAVSSYDAWAVGEYAPYIPEYNLPRILIERWDGLAWAVAPTPTTNWTRSSLYDVEAISSTDVWAVGWYCCLDTRGQQPLTMHWNGAEWQAIPVPTAPPGNPYGVPSLVDVEAINTNDVWAVGLRDEDEDFSNLLFLHWDGSQWSTIPGLDPGDANNNISALAAVASDDVWAVGHYSDNPGVDRSLVMHWDGTSWNVVPSPSPGAQRNQITSVAALSANDIWATMWYWDGPGTQHHNVYLHWDGQAWSIISDSMMTGSPAGMTAISSEIWAVGNDMSGRTLIEQYSRDFADVPRLSTFYSFVRCLACRGIVSGYSDGTFRPGADVTRGQLAKIVSNAAGFNEDPNLQIFEDVPSSQTFYQWINRLARRGYMTGYECGSPGEPCLPGNRPYFRPSATATRGQSSKIVANAAQYTEPADGQTFEDVPPTHTFYEYIQRLASRSIMQGYICGGVTEPCTTGRPYFRPQSNVTRGQSAKIVANTFFPNCETP